MTQSSIYIIKQSVSKFQSRMRTIYQNWWGYPLLLLMIGLITYLYPLFQLGFYWDDWEVVYLTKLATPKILEDYFFFDRPLAWPYIVYSSVLGAYPYFWHLLTILLRIAGTLFFYLTFVRIWPKNRSSLQWGGLLLIVFPAFLQQPIATAFSRHFTAFMLCGLSFFFTVLAIQTKWKKLFWLLAWITGTVQLFTIEYFAGLELVRPVLIWLLLKELPLKLRIKQTAFYWFPFLSVFLVFGWWRVFYYPTLLTSKTYLSQAQLLTTFQHSPANAIANLIESITQDSIYLIGLNWISLLTDPERINFMASSMWFGLALAAGMAGTVYFFIGHDEECTKGFGAQTAWLGWVALLCGGIPVWLIGKQVSKGGNYDNRFAIGLMLGVILIIVAQVHILIQQRWRKSIFTILFILGIFTQASIVNNYRREWANERNYFWQLSWRIPNLKEGTAVLGGYAPSILLPDYDTSFALALLFSDKKTGRSLPYWYYTWDGMQNLIKMKDGAQASRKFRNLTFQGFLGQSVMIHYQPPPGCVRVADNFYNGDPALGPQKNLLTYSDLSLIETEVTHHQPPEDIFGLAPSTNWCYYFQKADLARQLKHWPEVIDYYSQAKDAGFAPTQGGEYLPFLEALAQTGDWEKAFQTSQKIIKLTSELKSNVCAKWLNYSKFPSADPGSVGRIKIELACQ